MEPGDVFGGRFELGELAGAGGSGVVWRAWDRLHGAPVALKVLRSATPHSLDRLAREARILGTLLHPAIVRYVAHGALPDGTLFLAMEWLDGESLHDTLARRRLAIDECVDLAVRVAEALAVAHASGVVHRDIKPSNLFLVGGVVQGVRIIDFGIARPLDGASQITLPGKMLGTPGYISPEQARGAEGVDARTDLFSLGAVLFKCLTGRAPFTGDEALAVLLKVVLEEVPRVRSLRPGVPPALDELVAHMLAKDPAERCASAYALAAELRALGAIDEDDSRAPGALAEPAALTTGETVFVSLVIACMRDATPPTLVASRGARPPADVEAVLAPHLVTAGVLDDGSIVVVPQTHLSATDRAVIGARAALALRSALPERTSIVLATGRGDVSGPSPIGEAVDRAMEMLDRDRGPGVAIDDVTAVLLAGRFDVCDTAAGPMLLVEREIVASARTILGRESPFVGRDRDIAMLTSVVDECVEESRARAVVVTAAAGVGKSRLCQELLEHIRSSEHDIRVLFGRGDPMAAGSPFGILASALRRAAGISVAEPASVRAQKLFARVCLHVPEEARDRVAVFLGEMAGVRGLGEPGAQVDAVRTDPVLMGDHLCQAWLDFLAAESDASPVLLVLDDLHWGDPPSIRCLDKALRLLGERRFMVLAFARPDVESLLAAPFAERGVLRWPLRELTPAVSARLVRSVLGEAVEDATLHRIVQQAAGNAFCLEEMMRGVAEGQGDTAPDTVLAMVESRLAKLDVRSRRYLRAASVFGDSFREDGVCALLGEEAGAHTSVVVDELVRREILVIRSSVGAPGARECAFRHALVRDAAYGTLTEADRALGHRLAGAWLERGGDADPRVVAEHYERGGELSGARAWLRRATDKALEANDFASVLACADRAIAIGAEGAALGALRLREAQACSATGENAQTEVYANEALALLPEGSPLWCEAIGEASLARGRLGHDERAVEIGRRMLHVASRERPSVEVLLAASRIAHHLLLGGCDEVPAALLARVEASPLSSSDSMLAGRMSWARGQQMVNAGEPGAASRLFRAAAGRLSRGGDVRLACFAGVSAGLSQMQIGAYTDAETTYRETLALAEKHGLRTVKTLVEHNLGLALARRGRLAEGSAMLHAAAEAYAAMGNLRMEKATRVYMASVWAAAGEHASAAREARAACAPPVPDGIRAHGLSALAEALRAQGRTAEALAAAREARAILATQRTLEEGEAAVRLALVECLRAAGDDGAALDELIAARQRILDRASRIQDPEHRKAFLNDVPEHARTLAVARACLGPPDDER